MDTSKQNACVIIPARYSSSRFPGKPLIQLLGKPMIVWVCELSAKAVGAENVFVATDDNRIASVVDDAGFKSIITSKSALTGTDRVAEAARDLKYEIYINVQGDEPLVSPDDICRAIHEKTTNFDKVINGFCFLGADENPVNLNIPKAVTAKNGKLIYISRSPIPGSKSSTLKNVMYKKQVCIYAFNSSELEQFSAHKTKSKLEEIEDIEILRFFELNIDILMFECASGSLAIDCPEDVLPVEMKLKQFLCEK